MSYTTQHDMGFQAIEVQSAVKKRPTPELDEKGRFKAGNSGNGGRPIGARNKLGEAFIQDLWLNWALNGAETIEIVRRERPADYLKVVASILPSTVNLNISAIEGMSDDELNISIRRLYAEAGNTIEGDACTNPGEPNGVAPPPKTE